MGEYLEIYIGSNIKHMVPALDRVDNKHAMKDMMRRTVLVHFFCRVVQLLIDQA